VINGLLLRHDSADRTEWKWTTLDWKVEELESRAQQHKLELSVDRRAFQAPGAGRTTLGLLFATIDPHDPTQWQDNITDYSPERDGRPGRVDYSLGPLAALPPPRPPTRPDLSGIANYLLYYGGWDRGIIETVYGYDLVILDAHRGPRPSQVGPVVRRIRAGKNGIPGDQDDVVVLGYISLGEDVRTFGNTPALPGDGRGPAYWDIEQGKYVYQNRGIASYYLDEKQGEQDLPGHDGLPDRHGTWGACFVNPGDPDWQAFLLGLDGRAGVPYSTHVLLDLIGYQGLFLDTPEVADPWHGTGYTAQGLYEAIGSLRQNFPGAVLLLNRGVFLFVPQFPVQYRWNPRKFIDIGLFESHFLDSDYHLGDRPFSRSPYFKQNTIFYDQKIQAELGRTDDSFQLMLSLDYAADPDRLAQDHPDVFREAIGSSVSSYGRIQLITTRLVDATPTLMRDEPPPEDHETPVWGSTATGFAEFLPGPRPDFMVAGIEDREAKPPRVGVQKAIPGDGQVTLRWDVAMDQTLPVKYNVYYSELWPFDIEKAKGLLNVATELGADYVDRSLGSADDGLPYQTTVTGLQNGKTTYFVVRAEDSGKAAAGEDLDVALRGPGGGLEDQNLNVVAAAPRARAPGADPVIMVDGAFDDWLGAPAHRDATGEADRLVLDWTQARFAQDDAFYYVFYETTQPVEPAAGQQVLINADGHSWTGLRTRGGADFTVRGGQLQRYAGTGLDDRWTTVGPVVLARDGAQVEMQLPRAILGASGEGPVFSFVGIRGGGGVDAMPDHGAGFFRPTEGGP
jgi:hypothetical protein